MQIVIDIPDEAYNTICSLEENTIYDRFEPFIAKAIKNGTPLLKGHGDLIDRKVLLNNGYQMEPVEMWYGIKYASTIIEADREGENADSD